MLDINRIKVGAQARAEVSEHTVNQYAEHLTDGGTFPPIIVFFDSTDYWLADGHHRLLAHQRIGCLTILEDVHVGTRRDAMKYALGANSIHGLPRSNADKRRAVELALLDQEWSRLSARELAKLCNVSHNLIVEMRNGGTAAKKTKSNKKAKVSPDDSKDKVEQNTQVSPDYSGHDQLQEACATINELNEENQSLRDSIAIGKLADADQSSAAEIITSLRAEIKTLGATNKALKSSLDEAMRELEVAKTQCIKLQRENTKLKGK